MQYSFTLEYCYSVTPSPFAIHYSMRSQQLRHNYLPSAVEGDAHRQPKKNHRKRSNPKKASQEFRSFRKRVFPKVFYNLILKFSCLRAASISHFLFSIYIFLHSDRATLIAFCSLVSRMFCVWLCVSLNRIQFKRQDRMYRGLENENRFRKSCVKDI